MPNTAAKHRRRQPNRSWSGPTLASRPTPPGRPDHLPVRSRGTYFRRRRPQNGVPQRQPNSPIGSPGERAVDEGRRLAVHRLRAVRPTPPLIPRQNRGPASFGRPQLRPQRQHRGLHRAVPGARYHGLSPTTTPPTTTGISISVNKPVSCRHPWVSGHALRPMSRTFTMGTSNAYFRRGGQATRYAPPRRANIGAPTASFQRISVRRWKWDTHALIAAGPATSRSLPGNLPTTLTSPMPSKSQSRVPTAPPVCALRGGPQAAGPVCRLNIFLASTRSRAPAALAYVLGDPTRHEYFPSSTRARSTSPPTTSAGWGGPHLGWHSARRGRREAVTGNVPVQYDPRHLCQTTWKYGKLRRPPTVSYTVGRGLRWRTLIPLLEGPQLQRLPRRYTNYSTSGGTDSWKVGPDPGSPIKRRHLPRHPARPNIPRRG